MLDSIYHMTFRITLKSHLWREIIRIFYLLCGVIMNVIMLCTYLKTTSGLSILLHGVISLPKCDVMR